ncbi:MAG: 50S ribosomal protein L29 [Firmicutes bacterium]|uniref:Large ribosomal subunit protein uL29 n=1 Tax=Candidatus Stercoripulliclostridium pullicola TaxID=2840953 RepID=A0A940DI61_9FIRM|nr:50S ribosomal protein L29 [Candidatus Stercoripulliclostridium pullicola]
MTKKSQQFFEMTNEELTNKVNELKEELFNLRFKHATNQLSNPMVLEECKKNIARAKTVLRQRELGISAEPEKAAKKTRARKKA